MEQGLEIGLLLSGIAIVVLSWLFLVVRAFSVHRLWGIVCLIPPLSLLFVVFQFRKARLPLVIMVAGIVIGASPLIYNRLIPLDLGPREKVLPSGEREITLTGWDRSDPSGMAGVGLRFSRWLNNSLNGWDRRDYSVLQERTDVVFLQMANADVTDETLENLRGLKQVKVLDLSDTQITDSGLNALKDLPALETLYIKRTAITDDGLSEHLSSLPSLKRLDVTGTPITADARKKWREAKPGRASLPR